MKVAVVNRALSPEQYATATQRPFLNQQRAILAREKVGCALSIVPVETLIPWKLRFVLTSVQRSWHSPAHQSLIMKHTARTSSKIVQNPATFSTAARRWHWRWEVVVGVGIGNLELIVETTRLGPD